MPRRSNTASPAHMDQHKHMPRSGITFVPPAPFHGPPMTRIPSRLAALSPFSRARPRVRGRIPVAMAVLSDEEKHHILQPSPYQPHRRAAIKAFEPPPGPAPPAAPEACGSHDELLAAIKEIRADPLEEHGGRIVTYRGSPQARLMIIGEAPGEEEDRTGVPFVGRAGQLLDKILAYGGFDVSRQVYVTNVVKRRPPDNRNPTRGEIEYFMPYLKEEMGLVDPLIVVLAGSIAARAMLGPHLRITKDRGRWYEQDDMWVMPVLHPSYLLRVPMAKYDMVKDIEAIREKYMELVPDDPLKELQK